MKRVLNIMVAMVLTAAATQSSAQCTVAWTGQNGNIVANNAGGGVSFGSFQGGNIELQGGVQNNIDGLFTTSILEVEAPESFSVYPNPSSGLVYIDVPNDVTVQVYSLCGQLVYSAQGGQVDLTNLNAGSYIIGAPGYSSSMIIKQ